MHRVIVPLLAVILHFSLFLLRSPAQGVITTVAGGPWAFSGAGGPATEVPLGLLTAVVGDSSGNVFAADSGNHVVVRISPAGVLTVVAGTGVAGFSGDGGPATSASLNGPAGLALDGAGNLYIADAANRRIRRVSAAGTITTFAGNGVQGFSGDGGPATAASLALSFSVGSLTFPFGLAVDASGNLYIADTDNHRIRKVSPSGIITTVAGRGTSGFSGDGGPATSASLYSPSGVAVDASGNLYIADTDNFRIRKVSASGTITTVAGNGSSSFSGDGGPATSAAIRPGGVAVDATGNIMIADTFNYRIRRVSTAGTITTIAGSGVLGFSGDGGPARDAALTLPFAVAADAAGNLYIADAFNKRIRKVDLGGIITTLAGNGLFKFAGDGGPAGSALLSFPNAVALDAGGNLYLADAFNSRIRRVSVSGAITTAAGSGTPGFSGDGGPATSATLSLPSAVTLDPAGNLYIADGGNDRIRKVSAAGTITTVAGSGLREPAGDGGPATSAGLAFPSGVTVDAAGNLYIAEGDRHRVRKVSPAGIITTLAGTGSEGFSGDGGPSTSARLGGPSGLAVDASGNLYIADTLNHRIRRISPGGIITTVAGTGVSGFSGDGGPATAATMSLGGILCPLVWRWTPRATSTSATPATTASAR